MSLIKSYSLQSRCYVWSYVWIVERFNVLERERQEHVASELLSINCLWRVCSPNSCHEFVHFLSKFGPEIFVSQLVYFLEISFVLYGPHEKRAVSLPEVVFDGLPDFVPVDGSSIETRQVL
jgi:hypothetical protein